MPRDRQAVGDLRQPETAIGVGFKTNSIVRRCCRENQSTAEIQLLGKPNGHDTKQPRAFWLELLILASSRATSCPTHSDHLPPPDALRRQRQAKPINPIPKMLARPTTVAGSGTDAMLIEKAYSRTRFGFVNELRISLSVTRDPGLL